MNLRDVHALDRLSTEDRSCLLVLETLEAVTSCVEGSESMETSPRRKRIRAL